jgi:hypothetical protein
MKRRRLALFVLPAVAAASALGGCGSDEDEGGGEVASEYGATPCKKMLAEGDRQARTLEGDPVDLPRYGYLSVQLNASRESFLTGEENEGYANWLTYYCVNDEQQTVTEAFEHADDVVTSAGGPMAAQEKYQRVQRFEEPPPL